MVIGPVFNVTFNFLRYVWWTSIIDPHTRHRLSDVKKDLTLKAKDKDKDQTFKAKDQDKD